MKKLFYLIIFIFVLSLSSCKNKEEKPKEIYIIFDTNGGDFEEGESGLILDTTGETIVKKIKLTTTMKLPVPKRDGYTFVQWNFNDEKFRENYSAFTKDFTLKAVWEKNSEYQEEKVSITFVKENGTLIEVKEVPKFSRIVPPSDPINGSDTFIGWYINDVELRPTQTVTRNIEVVAKFLPSEDITITFEIEDNITTHVIKKGLRFNKPDNPVVTEGYKFIKWLDSNNKEFDFSLRLMENTTIKAEVVKIEYVTITLKVGDVTVIIDDHEKGEKFSAPNLTTNNKFPEINLKPSDGNHKKVSGWKYVDPNDSTKSQPWNFDWEVFSDELTLEAVLEDVKYVTVIFYLDSEGKQVHFTNEYQENGKVLDYVPEPTGGSNKFTYWYYYDNDNNRVQYSPTTVINVNKEENETMTIEFYAGYEDVQYTVNLYKVIEGKEELIDTIQKKLNEDFPMLYNSKYYAENDKIYEFDKYALDISGNTTFVITEGLKVTSDMTIYAIYKEAIDENPGEFEDILKIRSNATFQEMLEMGIVFESKVELASDLNFNNQTISLTGESPSISKSVEIDGKGRTISNLTLTRSFFGRIGNGVTVIFKDITFDNITLNYNVEKSGLFFGDTSGNNASKIILENITIKNSNFTVGKVGGALLGQTKVVVDMKNITMLDSNINGGSNAQIGGLVGRGSETTTITGLVMTNVNVTGQKTSAGVFGQSTHATLDRVKMTNVKVSVTEGEAGLVAAKLDSSANFTVKNIDISNCSITGGSGKSNFGAIFGSGSSPANVENAYIDVDILGGVSTAGFVGGNSSNQSGSISNVLVTGVHSGTSSSKGIITGKYPYGTSINVFAYNITYTPDPKDKGQAAPIVTSIPQSWWTTNLPGIANNANWEWSTSLARYVLK